MPESVAPVQEIAVPETLSVMFIQVEPASTDPFRISPAARLAFNVPVMVCAAVLVKKSVSLDPVSAEISIALIVVVGGVILNSVRLAFSEMLAALVTLT